MVGRARVGGGARSIHDTNSVTETNSFNSSSLGRVNFLFSGERRENVYSFVLATRISERTIAKQLYTYKERERERGGEGGREEGGMRKPEGSGKLELSYRQLTSAR